MRDFLLTSKLVRYFGVALILVTMEVALFQLFFTWIDNYLWATTLSFALAVVGNWFLSRTVVFRSSRYSPLAEFIMVAATSAVGLAIQLGIIFLAVERADLVPIIGKITSITGAFFWNYWVRSRYIFNR